MAMTPYEVIIVGAGIMGSATAYYLSKQLGAPSTVLLLEQFDFLHRRGSSHGESRVIRRTYVDDHYTMLTKDAFQLWAEVEEDAQTKLLTMTGGIDFCEQDSTLLQRLVKSCEKHSVGFEVLGQDEVKKRFPVLNMPAGHVALYCPEAGVIGASKAVATFQSLAARHGCDLRDNCTVTEILEQDSPAGGGKLLKVATSAGREFFGKKCILVAGAWSKKLLKKCSNVEVPLQQVQATVAYWKVNEPERYSYSALPVLISYDEPKAYVTPILEYPNLIKCCPYSGPLCDPDNRTFQPSMGLIESRAKRFLQSFLPGVDLNPVLTETCLYTETPDEEYIIDTLPAHPNIIIGCGFSGHGFKLAVVVGKMLAELTSTGKHLYPDLQKHFALSRFSK